MSDFAIDIRNVVKRYEEHVAVRDLSLQVPRGSVYGLLGPNGAGKTTTIRMILDIILPDSGTISLFGQPNTTAGVLNRVGYLLTRELIPEDTAIEVRVPMSSDDEPDGEDEP